MLLRVVLKRRAAVTGDLIHENDVRHGRIRQVGPAAGALVCLVGQVSEDDGPVEDVEGEPFRRGFAEFQRCL